MTNPEDQPAFRKAQAPRVLEALEAGDVAGKFDTLDDRATFIKNLDGPGFRNWLDDLNQLVRGDAFMPINEGSSFTLADTHIGYWPPKFAETAIERESVDILQRLHKRNEPRLYQAAMVSGAIILMHSYENGNGRTARLASGLLSGLIDFEDKPIAVITDQLLSDKTSIISANVASVNGPTMAATAQRLYGTDLHIDGNSVILMPFKAVQDQTDAFAYTPDYLGISESVSAENSEKLVVLLQETYFAIGAFAPWLRRQGILQEKDNYIAVQALSGEIYNAIPTERFIDKIDDAVASSIIEAGNKFKHAFVRTFLQSFIAPSKFPLPPDHPSGLKNLRALILERTVN